MPRVTDEHRENQRNRIREAAMEVIRHKGLATTTMADIITASGLSAGAIYGYYKGKDELLREVATVVVDTKSERIEALVAQDPIPAPAVMVREMVASMPDGWVRGGLLLQFWGAAGQDPALMEQSQDVARRLMGRIERYLAAWLTQEGHDPALADTLTPALAGLIQGYVLQSSLQLASDAEAYLTGVDAVLSGILSGAANPSGA